MTSTVLKILCVHVVTCKASFLPHRAPFEKLSRFILITLQYLFLKHIFSLLLGVGWGIIPSSAQGILLALRSRDHSWWCPGHHSSARDQRQVGHIQVPYTPVLPPRPLQHQFNYIWQSTSVSFATPICCLYSFRAREGRD